MSPSKLLNLSELPLSHLQYRYNNTHFTWVLWDSDVKFLAQGLPQSRCSVNLVPVIIYKLSFIHSANTNRTPTVSQA